LSEGFESVYILEDGLEAWRGAGFPTTPVGPDALPGQRVSGDSNAPGTVSTEPERARRRPKNTHTHAFLPGLVENYARQYKLPIKRDLTVLFVDIADSTTTVVGKSPEEALAFVQRFMGLVTEVALSFCGDVKDYEGDGALLYFESVTEATQAALAIREALANETLEDGSRFRARFSLDVGVTVIGVVGTSLRRSVALIGPSINLAARLLKQIPPDGIIATETIVDHLRAETPALAERFALFDEKLELKGFEQTVVTAYAIMDKQPI
jgi:class 3 adenylate cyclase